MIKFRGFLLFILAVTMVSVPARSAYAAAFSCVANAAVPPTIRSEGRAELAGDLVLDCTGGIAGNPVTVSLTLYVNTAVTSRILSLPATTEALLIIDEPAPEAQVLNTNVFQGLLSGGNSISWPNITFTQPGDFGHRIFRLNNVRANGGGLSPGPGGTPGTLQGLISTAGPTSMPISNPVQVLAYVQRGISFSAGSATFNRSLAPGDSGNPSQFSITFGELFPTAYKKRQEGSFQNVPGMIYSTESGFTSSSTGGAGFADTGTRLVARFSRVPEGVGLNVPATVTGADYIAVLMTGTAPDFSGGTPASSGDIALAAGSGAAVWEIINANPLATQKITIPVTVSYSPGITGGTALVSGGLGPISPGATASATDPLPRFVDPTSAVTAFYIPAAVPAMGEFGMIIFMLTAGLGSAYYLRRQSSRKV